MKKLIQEYESKISDMDTVIKKKEESIREVRKRLPNPAHNELAIRDFREERKVAETKRQCYVQFIVDIESLQD